MNGRIYYLRDKIRGYMSEDGIISLDWNFTDDELRNLSEWFVIGHKAGKTTFEERIKD